jgi:hypothetical protein
MARDLERRLRKLEVLFPAPREVSEFEGLLPFMTLRERLRLLKAHQLGLTQNETFRRDETVIRERAKDRRDRGLSWRDMGDLNEAENAKEKRLWQLMRSVTRRHPDFYPSTHRFDVLDLSVDEIEQLTDLVTHAAKPDDLAEARELIEKLRVDGRHINFDEFVAIVFEGRLGEEPKVIRSYLA